VNDLESIRVQIFKELDNKNIDEWNEYKRECEQDLYEITLRGDG